MLGGIVEIDETYIGGKKSNKPKSQRIPGRGGVGKQIVLGMRERGGKTITGTIPNTGVSTMRWDVARKVETGATIYTDELASYKHLREKYTHKSVKHSAKQFAKGNIHTNSIESVWAVC